MIDLEPATDAEYAWRKMAMVLPLWVHSGCEKYEPIVAVNASVIYAADNARVDSFVKLEGGRGLVIGHLAHIASFAHIGIGGGMTIV